MAQKVGVSISEMALSIIQTASFEITKIISHILKEFKMDTVAVIVAVIVPEFGPMAFAVLSVAIIAVLIVGIKQEKLMPKL